MPLTDVEYGCGHTGELIYRGSPSEAASRAVCPHCGYIGGTNLFSMRPNISMDFVPGKYDIGTGGRKYYNTKREMMNDAARNDIRILR